MTSSPENQSRRLDAAHGPPSLLNNAGEQEHTSYLPTVSHWERSGCLYNTPRHCLVANHTPGCKTQAGITSPSPLPCQSTTDSSAFYSFDNQVQRKTVCIYLVTSKRSDKCAIYYHASGLDFQERRADRDQRSV